MEVSDYLRPVTLPPGKDPRYLFLRRLGGPSPQSRSGRCGAEKIPLPHWE